MGPCRRTATRHQRAIDQHQIRIRTGPEAEAVPETTKKRRGKNPGKMGMGALPGLRCFGFGFGVGVGVGFGAGTCGWSADLCAGDRTPFASPRQRGPRRLAGPVVYHQNAALIITGPWQVPAIGKAAMHMGAACWHTYASELVFGFFLVFGFCLVWVRSQARCAVCRADCEIVVSDPDLRREPERGERTFWRGSVRRDFEYFVVCSCHRVGRCGETRGERRELVARRATRRAPSDGCLRDQQSHAARLVTCQQPEYRLRMTIPENAPDHCPASRTKKNTRTTSMTISPLSFFPRASSRTRPARRMRALVVQTRKSARQTSQRVPILLSLS